MTPNKKKNIYGIHIDDFYPEYREYAEEFQCIFCKLVSSKNICLFCNHCICEDCLENANNEKCPIDKEPIIKDINAFDGNLIGKTLLDDLKVKCIFNKKGCSWNGLFKDFDKKHLPICKYKSNEDCNINISENEKGKVSGDDNNNIYELNILNKNHSQIYNQIILNLKEENLNKNEIYKILNKKRNYDKDKIDSIEF